MPFLSNIQNFRKLVHYHGPIVGAAVENYYQNIGAVNCYSIHYWFGSPKIDYINHHINLDINITQTNIVEEQKIKIT